MPAPQFSPPTVLGLRGRFLALALGIYAVIGTLAIVGFFQVTGRIIHSLGSGYARQYANQKKAQIQAKLEREIVLAQKMVSSPLLRDWCLHEEDAKLKALALEDLESYRKMFGDHSYFFIIDASKNYYFNNTQNEFRGHELRYVLNTAEPNSAWYAKTLQEVDLFSLHVDNNPQLGLTKVWINAVVKDGDKKIGVGGSGLDLTAFLQEVLQTPGEASSGVETVLVDRLGFVQGHSDRKLMESNAQIRDENKRMKVLDLVSGSDQSLVSDRLAQLANGTSTVETFEINRGGRRILVGASYAKELEWAAVVFVDPAQVVQLKQFLPILALLALSFLASLVLVSYALDRLVLRRLARLTQKTREIAQGDYTANLEVDFADEIGQLTQSFDEMTAKIRDDTQNLENKVSKRAQELQLANLQWEDSNRKVLDSIHYARLLQSAFLAKPSDLNRVFADSLTYWHPRDVVGGDYYALYTDTDGEFLLALGDCTGHGVAGALMTMASKALLDRAVAISGFREPARLLSDLHRLLQEDSQNGLRIALVWGKSGSPLRFAGACMDLWVEDPVKGFYTVGGDQQSLGDTPCGEDLEFTRAEIETTPGQRFYLVSKGILEQTGGPKNLQLGAQRLQEALSSWRAAPMPELSQHLDKFLEEFMAGDPQRDDITVVGFSLQT